jgi:D-aspartate ligase
LRQGRSSFFVTLNGYNLAKYVVEDYIEGSLENEPTVYANKNKAQHKLWLGVPVKVFNKYAAKNDATKYADELIKQDRVGTTVFYSKDNSFRRWLLLTYMFHNYVKRFDKYFQENKGRDFK